jgi:hypothetical protein
MKKDFDEKALYKACEEVTKHTLWINPAPMDFSDIIDSAQIKNTAQKYFEEAKQSVEFVLELEGDPNLVTRAVLYLAQIHAIPPMKDNVTWFKEMLMALVELACPNMGHSEMSIKFLCDIEEGIKQSRQNMT